jgi:hypothetical protein
MIGCGRLTTFGTMEFHFHSFALHALSDALCFTHFASWPNIVRLSDGSYTLIDAEHVQKFGAAFPASLLIRPPEAVTCGISSDMWMFHHLLNEPSVRRLVLADEGGRLFERRINPAFNAGTATARLVATDEWLNSK